MFSTRAGRRRPAVCGRRDSRRLSRPVGFDPDARALPVEAMALRRIVGVDGITNEDVE